MMETGDNKDWLGLTAEQRRRIYEEEKHLIEQSAPYISKRKASIIVIYCLGCLIIYSGILQALINLMGNGRWVYHREVGFFYELFNAAFFLSKPLIGFIVFALPVAILLEFIWPNLPDKFMDFSHKIINCLLKPEKE